MISLHTSPLAQPGEGDCGGMNVYVRELAASLAQGGVPVSVYVRAWRDGLPSRLQVEPHFEVVHVAAGPMSMAKEDLPGVLDAFADGVATDLAARGRLAPSVLHANYWLSGVAAHRLKHRLSMPMVTTFHTLAAVKSEAGDPEPTERERAEREVIGCSDRICAANALEAAHLIDLYDADPERIEIAAPGVDRAFFSPGDQGGARRALGLPSGVPLLVFVGRIQPLKGLELAVSALAELRDPTTQLLVVGGPSGREGADELRRVEARIAALGLAGRVRFVDPQPHHLLSTYYRAADVCVVPSRSESFGLVALEAAACGTPVVASAVGGLTGLVEDGATGRLVAGRDPSIWAAAIDDVMSDPARRARLGRSAVRLSHRFGWASTAARLRRVYADLSVERVPASCGVGA